MNLVGVARSTWHYRANPRPRVENPIHQKDRNYPKALTEEELQRVKESIAQAWEDGGSVNSAYDAALGRGEAPASRRTWYRVANRMKNQEDRP